ncbi:MAG: hypothetical protein NWF04_05530 [Candidatus Bathyarchaeota archaeon]|nr:hypothetical protein [Candidatus Bathyarchaeota archaeon]
MKKTFAVVFVAVLSLAMLCGAAVASNSSGPAPNSGDGVPDGSGQDSPNMPSGGNSGPGPAPNSGDGISDGSGF